MYVRVCMQTYPMNRVKGSLWNTVKSITLEHNHFGIALEHKMLHHIRPHPNKPHISLQTSASFWKPRAFQSDALYQKRTPMRNVVLRSAIHMRQNFANHLRTKFISPAFCRSLATKMPVKTLLSYLLITWPSSTYSETMNHLTVQLSYVLPMWFYLLGFWGMGGERGFLGFTSCANAISATPATKWRLMSPSATPPGTQSEGRCHQAPRLPTQHGRRCHQVPRLPHKMKVAPATQNETGCRQVPCLPILTATMVLPFKLLGGGVVGD